MLELFNILIVENVIYSSEMRDPLRDCVRATMHDGTGAAVLDGQRAGVHHCPGEDFGAISMAALSDH